MVPRPQARATTAFHLARPTIVRPDACLAWHGNLRSDQEFKKHGTAPACLVAAPRDSCRRACRTEAAAWPKSCLHAARMKSSDRHSTTFPPQTALPQVDQLRAIAVAPVRPLGTYCPLPNGFCIDDEVVISTRHLRRPSAEILRTLLNEMVHQWQHRHGRPGKTRGSHHNLELRAKCAELGIPCDVRGCSVGIVAGSPFHVLLRTHGAGAQDSLLAAAAAAAGVAGAGPAPGSKLKKWHCGCTNVRCAVELDARCQRCGERFECAEPRGTARPDANVATPRTALSAPVLRTAASREYTGPDRVARRFQR
jgi:hypothetical protein